MTNEQQRMVVAAIERAHRQGVHVVTTGVRNDTGGLVWLVTSSSRPGLLHIVSVVDAHHLGCDCRAAEFGRYCCHRAAVRESLLQAQAATSRRNEKSESEATLYRNTKPFSIFAAE